jgi:ribosomal protein L13
MYADKLLVFMHATLRMGFSTGQSRPLSPISGKESMFNRKIKTIAATLAAATIFAANAQAHTVTITPQGKVRVTGMDATTKVSYSKRGYYNRVKVTSQSSQVQPDGSTWVFEDTSIVEVRARPCKKRDKRCARQRNYSGSRLVKVLPAPVSNLSSGSASANQPTPITDSGPDMAKPVVYSKPVLNCTFLDAWIVAPIPGYEFVSTGAIWCSVKHDDNDPVRVRAVSPDTEPAKFVPVEYIEGYTNKPCPADSSCFKTAYTLIKPGTYTFTVTVTTDSG